MHPRSLARQSARRARRRDRGSSLTAGQVVVGLCLVVQGLALAVFFGLALGQGIL